MDTYCNRLRSYIAVVQSRKGDVNVYIYTVNIAKYNLSLNYNYAWTHWPRSLTQITRDHDITIN